MTPLLRRRALAALLSLPTLGVALRAEAQIPVYEARDPNALVPPRPLEEPSPVYPESARAAGLEATVTLRLSIDEHGKVTEAEVVEPLGSGFDEAARDAALRLRFAPATKGGAPIPSRLRFAIRFAPPAEPPVLAPRAPVAPEPVVPGTARAPHVEVAPPPRESAVDVNVQGQLSEAQKLQQSAEAVSVVDMRRAREQTADLGEVLARNPGVFVRRDGGLGSNARFSLNGLYDDQVRFFLDGVPLDLAGYSFGIASHPVNLVERVEIYRGVVPVRFGADALGGAVNLVSDQTYRNRLYASYQLGSFGTQRVTASGRYRHQPSGVVVGANAFVDVAKNDYEVDVEIPDERGRLSPARVPRFHDGYLAYGGDVEAGVVEKKWAKRLIFRAFAGRTEKEIQHNVVMTVPYGEVQWGSTVYGTTARYSVDLTPNVDLDVLAGYSKRSTRFEDHGHWVYNWRGEQIRERRVDGEIESKPTDQLNWQHTGFGRASARWQVVPGHAITLSSSPMYATRTGDERLQADPAARDPLTAERKRFSLVSGVEYELSLFGDRLTNVLFVKDYVYRAKSEEPLPGGVFKKRDVRQHREGVGDALRFRFTQFLYAKASYEYATRLPSPDEVFGDGLLVKNNLDLRAEVSHNANVGPRFELMRTGAGDFIAEVNAFYRDSDQLIVLLGNDRYFTYQNVYRAIAKGLENSASWTSPGRYLSLDAGLTWLDQRNASSDGTFGDFEGDRIPNRPYLTGAWGMRLRFAGFPGDDDTLQPYYHGRYVHSFYRGWESQGLREYKQVVDAQVSHSAGVTWSLSESFGRVTTTGEVDNLTSAKLFDNFGVERPGRAFYLKIAAEI